LSELTLKISSIITTKALSILCEIWLGKEKLLSTQAIMIQHEKLIGLREGVFKIASSVKNRFMYFTCHGNVAYHI
jgi:hypothetical protein